ncbi:putative NADH-ubiquinone oxidoreductase B18 subunit (NDUFB7) [Lyophyllum shimeji]|uniref:NADH dehydrogenase [ubiquinone] 1 beta subcomplex subunit 7 n=1 Tax=Lyophyllum shimeji TaxID=47721 RepID=A0A9P3PV29_LYOSH|nr:putative NADH-ubiquinone oxidoreductase B18 subunit (NDUFB7) [Lyophyllum shimeji]
MASETMAETMASREEVKANRVPLGWRDHCSALLLPLNVCRKKNYYVPWECEHERHIYEKCQYDDYVRRMKALSKQKLAEREAAE